MYNAASRGVYVDIKVQTAVEPSYLIESFFTMQVGQGHTTDFFR